MRQLLRTTKALADENRIRIIGVLQGRELCVCQLIELLELAPSTVSKHLSILRNARLIESRKEGRWMYYRLSGKEAPTEIREALKWILSAFGNSAQQAEDHARMDAILEIDPEVLCSRQLRSNTASKAKNP